VWVAVVGPAGRISAGGGARAAGAGCSTITERADTRVRDEGLTFRQAHEIAATVAKSVIAREAPLGDGFAIFVQAFEAATGRSPRMSEPAFRASVAAETFVARRDRPGGPAPAALLPALEGYGATLADLQARQAARKARHAAAARQLAQAFGGITAAAETKAAEGA